jgi:hypothetical protein
MSSVCACGVCVHVRSGQPRVQIDEYPYVTLLYEALRGDGDRLPPVVFTSCLTFPKRVDADDAGYVHVVPGVEAPSGELTRRWFDTIQHLIEDGDVIVHDRGPEFRNHEVDELFADADVGHEALPASGGAFVNPCNNAFNSFMRRAFYRNGMQSYEARVTSVLDAYLGHRSAAVESYFRRCGLVGGRLTRAQVHALVSAGYRPRGRNHEMHDLCRDAFRAFQRRLRLVPSLEATALDAVPPRELSSVALDGVYWQLTPRP